MIDKYELAKEIGNFFGTYFEQNGKFCINNYDDIFRYDSVDALLTDWVNSLVEHQNDNPDLSGYWESEIEFIYTQVIGKYPDGVRPVENKTKDKTWKSSIDVKCPGNSHGKNLHLGTYTSVVDAIVARKVFAARMELEPHRPLNFWESAAKEVQAEAKAVKSELKTVTANLISAMAAYGADTCWTDREVFDALRGCGLTFEDFYKAGRGEWAKNFFREDSAPAEILIFPAETDARKLNSLATECDPYLFTCCADDGFSFLVRGTCLEDAEKCGILWYEENVFEPGKFKCWKTDRDDLDVLNRHEILESHAYVSMVHESSNSKKPLSQQILNAEGKATQQNNHPSFEKESHR